MKKHGCLFWLIAPVVLFPLAILSAAITIMVEGSKLAVLACKKGFAAKKDINTKNLGIAQVDCMNGEEFERYCAALLGKNGFTRIQMTPGSGDQGIDILAWKDQVKYGFQCKCYSRPVGNRAVQEVYSGKNFYNCNVGVVITNSSYTASAKELAKKNGIWLWDRKKMMELMQLEGYKQKNFIRNNQPDTDTSSEREDGKRQEFQQYCIELLSQSGFLWIYPPSNGKTNKINLVAQKGILKYVVRCEYSGCEVQEQVIFETVEGKRACKCDCGIVITNNSFAIEAKELAKKEKILLWELKNISIHNAL